MKRRLKRRPSRKEVQAALALYKPLSRGPGVAGSSDERSPVEGAGQASPKVKPVLQPDKEKFECDNCDGCGWTEGGKVIKTVCIKCKGKGFIWV